MSLAALEAQLPCARLNFQEKDEAKVFCYFGSWYYMENQAKGVCASDFTGSAYNTGNILNI